MDQNDYIAFSILASYFLIILSLLLVILRSFSWGNLNVNKSSYLFLVLALFSFFHTWYYMAGVFTTSFAEYESRLDNKPVDSDMLKRIATWLVDTSLFKEAWMKACGGKLNWWWSEQICTYAAGPWTVFLFVQGQRYKIKHLWAYMVLGQLVAISVAANLFYSALILSGWQAESTQRSPRDRDAPLVLWASVLLSLVTVANSPNTNDETFLPNLLIMHAILLLPLFFTNRPGQYSTQFFISYKTLYTILYSFIFALRLKTTLDAIRSVSDSVWGGFKPFCIAAIGILHSHPAQASIGWDVIWTSLSYSIWTTLEYGGLGLASFSSLFLSAGVVASWQGVFVEDVTTNEVQIQAEEKNK